MSEIEALLRAPAELTCEWAEEFIQVAEGLLGKKET